MQQALALLRKEQDLEEEHRKTAILIKIELVKVQLEEQMMRAEILLIIDLLGQIMELLDHPQKAQDLAEEHLLAGRLEPTQKMAQQIRTQEPIQDLILEAVRNHLQIEVVLAKEVLEKVIQAQEVIRQAQIAAIAGLKVNPHLVLLDQIQVAQPRAEQDLILVKALQGKALDRIVLAPKGITLHQEQVEVALHPAASLVAERQDQAADQALAQEVARVLEVVHEAQEDRSNTKQSTL